MRRLITETGALLMFLPPYCPQLNPVEMIIANAKTAIREQELRFSVTHETAGFCSFVNSKCIAGNL